MTDNEQLSDMARTLREETKHFTTPAVCYLRVSGAGQCSGDGFPRQLEACGKRAKSEGYTLLTHPVLEEGVSGTTEAADRPALAALLETLSAPDSPCKTILVERSDRLARDLVVSELILRECRRANIAVIECEGGNEIASENPDNPTATLIRQILAAVAQFEKSSLVLKLRKARQRLKAATKGKKGKEGTKPYGTRPGEEAGLALILGLAALDQGPTEIAEHLNDDKIPSRNGRPWTKSTVSGILSRQ